MRQLLRYLFLLSLASAFSGATSRAQQKTQEESNSGSTIEDKGVRVEFTLDSARRNPDGSPSIMEGDFAEIHFSISDVETGSPVSPLEPAVWIARESPSEVMSCQERIGRYLQGTLAFQADVDLNKYFILVMNNDQSISVIDPLMGMSGITQLYAMIILKDTGEDWTRSSDEKRLFVSMPKAGMVAVADLENFKVVENIEAGTNPVRVVFQPDGKYLWVGNDGDADGESGVTVIDAESHVVAGFVPTGAGHHEIVFTDDSLFAFVTNTDEKTVSVIDTQQRVKVRDLETGDRPLSIQFSSLSRALYVADEGGTITVLDGESWDVDRTIETAPGLVSFRLDPLGRWGFAANLVKNRVDVVDLSRVSITRSFEVEAQPHQFAFTDTYAYVRHLGTPEVTMIPLSGLAGQSAVAVHKVPLGSKAPGEFLYHSVADAISPTGEWTAVVAANPADRMVYYYMEGMIAPMGSYTTYGRIPRAVGVVDRSVRETAKGVYSAKFRVPASGDYNVAFLLDSPVVDHCFAFSAEPNPEIVAQDQKHPVELEFQTTTRLLAVGENFPIEFSLKRSFDKTPLVDVDVRVLAMRPPGIWQERIKASSLGDGRYEASITVDEPGAYYITVAIPAMGLDHTELPYFSFRATNELAETKQSQ